MRGTIHTIEAIIGALILLVGVMSIYPIEETREFYFSDQGYDCLKYLDQKGLLRYYIYNDLVDDLDDSLRSCLPLIADYKFQICSTLPCISPGEGPKGVRIIKRSSYLIAGENKATTNYDPKLINLWIWLK